MPHLTLLIAAVAAFVDPALGSLAAGHTPNKFIVKYTAVPSFEKLGFFSMPRNLAEAAKMGYAKAAGSDGLYDDVDVWSRQSDYRVCVLFDRAGSAAGMQIAIKASEQAASKAPVDVTRTPEWRRHKLLGEDVYSLAVFFVSKAVLAAGGRRDLLTNKEALTIADGIYLRQSDASGKETSRLHVPAREAAAEQAGLTKQACFVGMGMHYHQALSKTSQCEHHRPYFTMYDKKTSSMLGFGIGWYAKPSKGASRSWFESPIAALSKIIFPNAPQCFFDWIPKYGKFSLHVYFVENPWLIGC